MEKVKLEEAAAEEEVEQRKSIIVSGQTEMFKSPQTEKAQKLELSMWDIAPDETTVRRESRKLPPLP